MAYSYTSLFYPPCFLNEEPRTLDREEYLELLREHGVQYDERYVWG